MRGRSRCHKLSEEHARWPFWAFALIFSLWLELGGPPSGRFRSMNEGFGGRDSQGKLFHRLQQNLPQSIRESLGAFSGTLRNVLSGAS